MKTTLIIIGTFLLLFRLFTNVYSFERTSPLIIDHTCADITQVPLQWIESAKDSLHIAYAHTSHGSQITTGMSGLVTFANNGGKGLSLPQDIFAWDNGGTNGALDLHDYAMEGDMGYYPDWVNNTREYLGTPDTITGRGLSNTDVNVVIWSWCGQVTSKYLTGTLDSEYFEPMAQLELDYPGITFIYMTGHVDIYDDENNKAANQVIRNYCLANNKVLYDFEDIEHYDPDSTYFEYVSDNCDYYSAEGELLGNWAIEWQDSHTENLDWYNCTSAHSKPLNANQKAYAAWWMWASLAGWNTTVDSVKSGYISLTVDSVETFIGENVSVPVRVNFPKDSLFNNFEISLGGFQQSGIEFTGIRSEGGLIGTEGWTIRVNEADSLLITGATDFDYISGGGELFWMQFSVSNGANPGFVPITLYKGIFKPGTIPTNLKSGGIYLKFVSKLIEKQYSTPLSFILNHNYPNPFNPSTTIEYTISTSSNVEISVYNLAGVKLNTLVKRELSPGNYHVTWDGSNYASGVYLYQMMTENFVQSNKMLLIK